MIAFAAGPVSIEIVDDDIAAQDVDAVVNAANDHLWMGAGVAGALKRRGGVEIERDAIALGPIEIGACVMTAGYRLPARHVIHAAVMGQDLRTSPQAISRATASALRRAARERLASVALPAFGTGVGGFPVDACARLMLREVQTFTASPESLRLVRFVLFGRSSYLTFAEAAGELLGTPLDGPPDCPLST